MKYLIGPAIIAAMAAFVFFAGGFEWGTEEAGGWAFMTCLLIGMCVILQAINEGFK